MAAVKEAHASRDAPEREMPKLSIVTPDYDGPSPYAGPTEAGADDDPRLTQQIEEIEGPEGEEVETTAAQRIRKARSLNRSRFLQSTRNRVILFASALVVLAALGGGAILYARQPRPAGAVQPTPSVTRPAPTPTGFGDATATPEVQPTPTIALPPAGVIGVNGWVQVSAGGGLVVRDAPTRKGTRIMVIRDGTKAKVVEGPQDADGFTWWKIQGFDPKNPDTSGWCAGQYLQPIPPP
jgi:hypothetical protein